MNNNFAKSGSDLPSASVGLVTPHVSERSLRLYRFLISVRPAPVGSFLKKALGIKRTIVESDLGKFYIDPASNLGLTILEDGIYETEMVTALRRHLKLGSVCVDAGANEGYHSIVASRLVGQGGRVISIEPQIRVLSVFKKNIEINDCKNISIAEVAISDRAGDATLHLWPDVNTGPSSLEPGLKYRVPTQAVKTVTLESVFEDYGVDYCDMLKMDIEGLEYEAILGSAELFKRKKVRALAIEPTDRLLVQRGHRADDISSFLKDCGYSLDPEFINNHYRQIWQC